MAKGLCITPGCPNGVEEEGMRCEECADKFNASRRQPSREDLSARYRFEAEEAIVQASADYERAYWELRLDVDRRISDLQHSNALLREENARLKRHSNVVNGKYALPPGDPESPRSFTPTSVA